MSEPECIARPPRHNYEASGCGSCGQKAVCVVRVGAGFGTTTVVLLCLEHASKMRRHINEVVKAERTRRKNKGGGS